MLFPNLLPYIRAKEIKVSATLLITGLFVFLASMLFPGNLKGQGLIFSSLVRSCLAGYIVICVVSPRWSVPLLIVAVSPLRVFMTRFPLPIGEYTVVPLSAAIWLLSIVWFIRTFSLHGEIEFNQPTRIVTLLWLLMIVSSIPALFVNDQNSKANIVTWTFLITGIVEPFVLFLVIRSWISIYRNSRIILYSLIISLGMGLFMGIFVINIFGMDAGYDTTSQFRAEILGFASANLAGHVLCLLYPLIFILWNQHNNRLYKILLPMFLIIFWTISFMLLSRTPPVIMLLQTMLLLLWKGGKYYRRIIISSFLFITIAAIFIVPDEITTVWSRRMEQGVAYVQNTIQGNATISTNDAWRERERNRAIDYLLEHPFGGRGATGNTDPENLYLDIATQAGILTTIIFIAMMIYLMIVSWKSSSGQGILVNNYYLVSLIGYFIYGTLAGSQLTKISVSEHPFWVNASPSVFLVAVLAMASSSSTTSTQ